MVQSPLTVLSVVIAADPPARLDKALARDVPEEAALSRSRLARLIAEGAVRRGGIVMGDATARVAAGDVLEITLGPAEVLETRPQAIALDVLHEDADLIVIDKPAGMVVHPAPGSPDGTLVNALLHHCGDSLSGIGGARRPGIVHRIDKDTSGVLVVAKSDRAHHGLAAQFETHSAARRYLALAHGVIDPADPRLRGLRGASFEAGGVLCLRTGIGRHRSDRQRQAVMFDSGRHAVTRARMIESFGSPASVSLLECRLETGRTHQIRAHMRYAGHPLFNDATYGGEKILKGTTFTKYRQFVDNCFALMPRHALHARTLSFVHPASGEQMHFESPLPSDMQQVIEKWRSYSRHKALEEDPD